MEPPARPEDEAVRLATLRRLAILDTPPEDRFDRATRLAQRLFGTESAVVTLVDEDRAWFKSRQGLDVPEVPRDLSFCGHAILGTEALVVPDSHADPRFADNPLVTGPPNIRFYAGYPLSVGNGSPLGTLCLLDPRPREMSAEDLEALRDLGAIVERELATLELATLDYMTGTSNRRGFHEFGRHLLADADRHERAIALLYIDVDHMKHINDSLGHAAGDRALVETALVLQETLRECDLIGRVGGDEFCALLTDTDADGLASVVDRLGVATQERNATEARDFALSLSTGWVLRPPRSSTKIDELIEQADAAMYAAKRTKHGA